MSNGTSTAFAIATREIERSSVALGLSERETGFLRATSVALTLEFPYLRDRERQRAAAHLVSLWPRPARGGIVRRPGVTQQDCVGLARVMRTCHGLWAPNTGAYVLEGGGSIGIALEPGLTPGEWGMALDSVTVEFADHIGQGKFTVAPDLGTTTEDMGRMGAALARVRWSQPGAFAGKPVLAGGRAIREGEKERPIRLAANGYGGALAVVNAIPYAKLNRSEGATFALIGLGTAGRETAQQLIDKGLVMAAAGDATDGGIRATTRAGIDMGAIDELLLEGARITDFPDGEPLTAAALWREPVDVLILAQRSGMLTLELANTVQAEIVAEAIPAAVTVEAEEFLVATGRMVIPGEVAGVGAGAKASALELAGATHDAIWPALDADATAVHHAAFEFAVRNGLTVRTAAWALAEQRLLRYARECGEI